MVTIATVAAFFYTVIPLYQKAAVDELIARREAELKVAQESLAAAQREAYAQHRQNFMERFGRVTSNECSGILRDLMTPVGRFPVSPEAREAEHNAVLNLEIDVGACLSAKLTSSKAATVLSSGDLGYLGALARDLGTKCDTDRSTASRRIADLPQLSSANPALLDPPGDVTKSAHKFQDEIAARLHQPLTETQLRSRHDEAVRLTQERVARDYRQQCAVSLLDAFWKIRWPVSSSVVPASAPAAAASYQPTRLR